MESEREAYYLVESRMQRWLSDVRAQEAVGRARAAALARTYNIIFYVCTHKW